MLCANPTTAKMALEVLVMLTGDHTEDSADTVPSRSSNLHSPCTQVEASRLALLRTSVVSHLRSTVKIAALQTPTLQLITHLLQTGTSARAELRQTGALEIVLEVASTTEWEESLEVEVFFQATTACFGLQL